MNIQASEQEDQVKRRMETLGVRENEIHESFVRSGGHGGQNVNKTATCVMLVHQPTGSQVKCQTTRQQGLNRIIARQLLLDKIEARQQQRTAAERAQIELRRRQKRGRSRKVKERVLAEKSRQSVKKQSRRRADIEHE